MASNRMPLAMLALLVALAPAISGLRADNFTITVKNLDGTNVPPPLPGVPVCRESVQNEQPTTTPTEHEASQREI